VFGPDPIRSALTRLWRFTDPFIPAPIALEGGVVLLRTRLLIFFCWLFMTTALLAVIPRAMQEDASPVELGAFLLITLLAGAAPWGLRRYGRSEPISIFVLAAGLLAAILGAVAMEGLFSASLMWLSTLPFITAFLISPASTFLAIAVSSSLYVSFGVAHHLGWLDPEPLPSIVHRAVNLTALTVFSAVVARLHQWSADQARAGERDAQKLVQVVSRRMGIGTVVVQEGNVVLANAAAHSLLGLQPDALIGRSWADAVPEAANTEVGTQELDVAAGPDALRVEVRTGPLGEAGGDLLLVTLTDITQRWADEQARRRAQAQVEAALREKETLLREIHHRVKNNLQIVSSLLTMQKDRTPNDDARASLLESVHRVRSMSLIHEQLYAKPSLSSIEFGAYARRLVATLASSLAPGRRFDVHAEVIELPVDKALPLGLALNELLTNAVKYGLTGPPREPSPPADVVVTLSRTDTGVRLTVRDFGPGFPADFQPEEARTLGFRIACGLVQQVSGALRVVPADGGCVEITL
jgi:two-component sensor histidine kinase/PAS domain-containing protein